MPPNDQKLSHGRLIMAFVGFKVVEGCRFLPSTVPSFPIRGTLLPGSPGLPGRPGDRSPRHRRAQLAVCVAALGDAVVVHAVSGSRVQRQRG
jgi:hypothetical protein